MVYWGRNPNKVIDQWCELDRVRKQVETGRDIIQIRANLWMVINDGVTCSCKKNEGFDKLCFTCYGTGFIGGFRKIINFYNTLSATGSVSYNQNGVVSSISNPLLVNIEQVTDILPFRYRLVDGEGSGTIEWTGLDLSDIYDFQFDNRAFLRDTDLGTAEVSVDINVDASGYVPITTLVGNDFVGAHSADVRISLSRSDLSMRSPLFEILRIRGRKIKKDVDYIIISKSRGPEDEAFERTGKIDIESGISGLWTILEFEITPKALIEMIDSPFTGNRYQLFNFRRSFWKDKTFRQIFDGRMISRDREIFNEVF